MSLKTQDLVNILSAAQPARTPVGFMPIALFMIAFFGLTTFFILGIRSDLSGFSPPVSFFHKSFILLSAGVSVIVLLSRAAKPLGKPLPVILTFIIPVYFIVLLLQEWRTVPSEVIINNFGHINFPICLMAVMIYGLLGMTGLTALMKRYAPPDEIKAATLIGLAAACLGAAGYSIHCKIDSPTFILIAYGIPILVLTLMGRVLLPRFIKW